MTTKTICPPAACLFVATLILATAGTLGAQQVAQPERNGGPSPNIAQPPSIPGPPAAPGPATGQPGLSAPRREAGHDFAVAAWLAIDNHGEIVMGQFAQQHASSQPVRDFARTMIREHREFDQRLRQAGMGQAMRPGQPAQSGQPGPSAATGRVPVATAEGQSPGPTMERPLDLLRIKDETARQELTLAQRELGRHQGAHFDKGYIGQQIVSHVHMLAALQVARNHASPNLHPVIDQGIQSTQRHLEHARQLMQQLEAQPPSTTARRPTTESEPRRE